jgi:hypothetical protein
MFENIEEQEVEFNLKQKKKQNGKLLFKKF